MITNELKSNVDKIWETFWTGGISNPLTVIEQFTYLIFIRSLDTAQKKITKKKKLDSSIKDIFPEDKQHLRWETLKENTSDDMYKIFKDEVFEFIKNLSDNQSSFA
ncbi:type I restriction-modification system subunit M N-terminal domain-containing protein, partial [Poseidonibacter sp.]|uniref:type I restriction-modification system subunit M N-terminal domain-containing protein n=1 Tax=Poseidonibacter sp. TaxID=2321188 RepID=UPI003C783F90